ncbi:MAG TPA: hypothetical protein PLN95_04455 [Candidatus Saccharibacteria bacterium]|nr:hypothetical protein [Candidatus Saccharibacteria bacterium]
MPSVKDRLRAKLDDRKTPYPKGTRRKYLIGGIIAIIIPIGFIKLAYFNGAYDGEGEWIYMFVTPWHLLTLVGLYYVSMSMLIKEKRKRK